MVKICKQCWFDYSYSNYDNKIALRFSFSGQEKIKENYSQSFQDLFVLTVLNGKENGKYLEIGSAWPIFASNTYLLEKEFNWTGIGVEIDEERVKLYNETRKNKCLSADAKNIDYAEILKDSKVIDYLQIDCEPARQSYEILTKIPFDSHTFNVITFEHDFYVDNEKKYKDLSRKFLQNLGYVLVVPDVAIGRSFSYEDWWVHQNIYETMNKELMSDKRINCVEEYIYKDYTFNRKMICTHE